MTFTLELLSLPLTSCVTSAKLFNISKEQFSHLKSLKKKERKKGLCWCTSLDGEEDRLLSMYIKLLTGDGAGIHV